MAIGPGPFFAPNLKAARGFLLTSLASCPTTALWTRERSYNTVEKVERVSHTTLFLASVLCSCCFLLGIPPVHLLSHFPTFPVLRLG